MKQTEAERQAFRGFIERQRLAASICYSWSGLADQGKDPLAIFRCGALTDAGNLALSPM